MDGMQDRTAPAGERAVGEAVPARVEPLGFHGDGWSYFRIWIVNVALTILTLGLWSPWAKVRTNRYFYGATELAGSRFAYLADPWVIFRGRLVALLVVLAWMAANAASPALGLLLGLAFLPLVPWLICRSLAFRARNSAWRGVRFGFDGRYVEALTAYLLWPFLAQVTLGLLGPVMLREQDRFTVGRARFGTTRIHHEARLGPYWRLWLTAAAIGLAGLAAFVTLVLVARPEGGAEPGAAFAAAGALAMGLWLLALVLAMALVAVGRMNLRYGHLRIGPHRLRSRFRLGPFLRLQLGNTLGLILTLGLFWPWAAVRTARYLADHLALEVRGDLEGFVAAQDAGQVGAVGDEVGEALGLEVGF